jgi:hypothetical protein
MKTRRAKNKEENPDMMKESSVCIMCNSACPFTHTKSLTTAQVEFAILSIY